MFAAEIRQRRVDHHWYSNWRWHLDAVLVRSNGATHYLWCAVDHAGEVREVVATQRRDRRAALRFLQRAMQRYGRPAWIVTDRLRSYGAAMKDMGSKMVSFAVSGSTIEPRTHPNRSADETERWPGSGTSRPCRNSPPFTSRSTTTSTTNAISTAATFSNQPTLLRWLSGGNLQPESRSL